MKPGDYLFVQFGHNDMKSKATNALEIYKADLKKIVERTRTLGGTPVLVTSMERKAGVETNTLMGYPQAVRDVAKEENCALIDLNAMSLVFYRALGTNLDKAFQDGTHHNNYGSYELAKCVVEGIRQDKLPLAKFIMDDFGGFDPAQAGCRRGIFKCRPARLSPPRSRWEIEREHWRLFKPALCLRHFHQEQSANDVVAAFVRVFEVVKKPIMRVVAVKMCSPELRAMNAVTEKGVVDVNYMNLRMKCRTALNHIVVSVENFWRIFPRRQPGQLRITDAVGRVKNVRHENFATAGKTAFDLGNRFLQATPVVFHPRLGLLPGCAIHGFFSRRRAAVIVDDVVSARGHDDNSQHTRIICRKRRQLSACDFSRSAA